MSMTIDRDNLWLCDDCMIRHETGESEGTSPDRLAEIDAGLASLGPHLVSDWDSETEEGMLTFSRRPCDACGTHLAGGRHRYCTLKPAGTNA